MKATRYQCPECGKIDNDPLCRPCKSGKTTYEPHTTEIVLGIVILLIFIAGITADYMGLTTHPQWAVPGYTLIKDK